MSVDHTDPVDPTSSKVTDRQTAYPNGLLFPENEIFAFAVELPASFLPLFRVALDAVNEPERDGLDATAVSLMRHLAEDYGEETYQRLMASVLKAIDDGPVGILAAYRTIRRVVELLEICTGEESIC